MLPHWARGVLAVAGAAFGVTRYATSLLYGVRSPDSLTFTAVAIPLLVVAAAACAIPARPCPER